MPTSTSQEPKYLTIFNLLKSRIEEGEMKVGDRLPSFAEMQVQFGARATTVDRIYSRLEKEKLIVREQGRGTFVRQQEIRIPTGVIGIYGIEFTKGTQNYWSQVMQGMNETAERHHLQLLLLHSDSSIKWEKMDGFITHELTREQTVDLQSRMPRDMHFVATLGETMPCPSVVIDDYQGSFDLTNHLIKLGHRRIARLDAVGLGTIDAVSSRRFAGYRDAMHAAGIQIEESWMRELFDTRPNAPHDRVHPIDFLRSGAISMEKWLTENWHSSGCTALMAHNDDVAIGAIKVLKENGIMVPKDLSVTGFDGAAKIQYFEPQLTTIKVPLREVGLTAFEILLHQIDGESVVPMKTVLPVTLLVGSSTGAI